MLSLRRSIGDSECQTGRRSTWPLVSVRRRCLLKVLLPSSNEGCSETLLLSTSASSSRRS